MGLSQNVWSAMTKIDKKGPRFSEIRLANMFGMKLRLLSYLYTKCMKHTCHEPLTAVCEILGIFKRVINQIRKNSVYLGPVVQN